MDLFNKFAFATFIKKKARNDCGRVTKIFKERIPLKIHIYKGLDFIKKQLKNYS